MADISKATGYTPVDYVSSTPIPGVSLATRQPGAEHCITGLLAGENVAAGDACYIKTSDGKVYRSTGAAANAAAVVDGFAAENCNSGEAITLFHGVIFNYGSGLSPGTPYYLSGVTAGALADATSTGGTVVIGRSMDATRVYVRKSY